MHKKEKKQPSILLKRTNEYGLNFFSGPGNLIVFRDGFPFSILYLFISVNECVQFRFLIRNLWWIFLRRSEKIFFIPKHACKAKQWGDIGFNPFTNRFSYFHFIDIQIYSQRKVNLLTDSSCLLAWKNPSLKPVGSIGK